MLVLFQAALDGDDLEALEENYADKKPSEGNNCTNGASVHHISASTHAVHDLSSVSVHDSSGSTYHSASTIHDNTSSTLYSYSSASTLRADELFSRSILQVTLVLCKSKFILSL